VTQVVDIARGVHTMISKNLFTGELRGQIPWYSVDPSFPREAVTQLASANMVTIRLLPFLAIPAQAGTHASTST
jgi:hypothetical protein